MIENEIRRIHNEFFLKVKDKKNCLDFDKIKSKMKYGVWNHSHWNDSGNKNLIDKILSREMFQNDKDFPIFSLSNFILFLGDSILFIGGSYKVFGTTFIHEFYTLEEVMEYVFNGEGVVIEKDIKSLKFVEKNFKAGSIDYMSFKDAKRYVSNLNIRGVKGWREYCKSENKPINIPNTPNIVYKNKGFVSLPDFLGYQSNRGKKIDSLNYLQAKKICSKFKVSSASDYKIKRKKEFFLKTFQPFQVKHLRKWGGIVGVNF